MTIKELYDLNDSDRLLLERLHKTIKEWQGETAVVNLDFLKDLEYNYEKHRELATNLIIDLDVTDIIRAKMRAK